MRVSNYEPKINEKVNPSIKYPDSILKFLSQEEKISIKKIFGVDDLLFIDLVKELNKIVQPARGLFQKKLSYEDILNRIIKKYSIDNTTTSSIHKKEVLILGFKFDQIIKNLSHEEKQKFDIEIQKFIKDKDLDSNQIGAFNTVTALTAANLSGFGIYLAASTIVGGITSVLGITLPFVFYTSMSSAISIITGPVGWAIGLGYLAYSYRNETVESASFKIEKHIKRIKNTITGNIDHALIAVSLIASYRIVLNEENSKKKDKMLSTLDTVNNNVQHLMEDNDTIISKIDNLNFKLVENKERIIQLEDESFSIETELNKINNFYNQTFK